jgi:hypothetical protein
MDFLFFFQNGFEELLALLAMFLCGYIIYVLLGYFK